MNHDAPVSRRDFLRTGAVAAAAAAASVPARATAQDAAQPDGPKPPAAPITLPRRKLGKTGEELTLLGQGGAFAINERHLNMVHSLGVRFLDTAKYYLKEASERAIGDWFEKTGHRKEYFLVTKDVPLTPDEMVTMVDQRLVPLKTDYLDAFYLHGMGDTDHYHGADDAKWFSDPEWAKAADKIKKSGKCRFIGFSSHAEPVEVRVALLNAAAKGGWVDLIMVATDPTLLRGNAKYAKAIDACHQAGIGLISMKENRGGPEGIDKVFPTFAAKGLSAYTAVLSAMWTDERFTSVCSHMDTFEKLNENATACKNFKPLTAEELAAVDTMLRQARRTYCAACDGSCRRAAGTDANLNTIARYVNYAQEDGRVYEARERLAAMPIAARNWHGADLAAASRACKCNLDFAAIIKRAEELLA